MKLIEMTLVALALLSSCAFAQEMARGGSSSTGGGNPATGFCIQNGGKIEPFNVPAGQDEWCVFDSARIPEWTFFYAMHGTDEAAVKIFLEGTAPNIPVLQGNPASEHCSNLRGITVVAQDLQGNQSGVCQFHDRSGIEEWTLFHGPKYPGNARLTKLLRSRPSSN